MLDSCKMVQKQSEAFFKFLWHENQKKVKNEKNILILS